MTIFTYESHLSSGVSAENEANKDISKHLAATITNCLSPIEFYSRIDGPFWEYKAIFSSINSPKKILDVGAGRGDSSIYLAELGHNVHSVEPSPDLCEIICAAAGKFKLSITVHQTVGEYINNIEEDDFDIVCFNASLHHCDDPLLALRNCYQKLRPGGRIYLLNETILKPYRSEKGYQLLLQKYPEKMGHYGGNEHAYHCWKYKSLIRQAGFTKVALTSAINETDTLLSIEHKVSRKWPNGTRIWGPTKAFIAINWFFIRTLLLKTPIISQILLHSSMVQAQFKARKP
jgi:SAM-dependent methyltransferase